MMIEMGSKRSSSRWNGFVISRHRDETSLSAPVGLILLVVGVAVACAAPPTPRALVLDITNDLGRTVLEIRRKPCGDLELAFVPIKDSRLAAGQTHGIVLPPTCVDLVAFDVRGRIVGEQRGLKMLPGARWVLRR